MLCSERKPQNPQKLSEKDRDPEAPSFWTSLSSSPASSSCTESWTPEATSWSSLPPSGLYSAPPVASTFGSGSQAPPCSGMETVSSLSSRATAGGSQPLV